MMSSVIAASPQYIKNASGCHTQNYQSSYQLERNAFTGRPCDSFSCDHAAMPASLISSSSYRKKRPISCTHSPSCSFAVDTAGSDSRRSTDSLKKQRLGSSPCECNADKANVWFKNVNGIVDGNIDGLESQPSASSQLISAGVTHDAQSSLVNDNRPNKLTESQSSPPSDKDHLLDPPVREFLVGNCSDNILNSLQKAVSVEDARECLIRFLTIFSCELEAVIIKGINSEICNKSYGGNGGDLIPGSELQRLNEENAVLSKNVTGLKKLLEKERAEVSVKTTELHQLQADCDSAKSEVEQMRVGIKNYIQGLTSALPSRCGINERLPPDVY